MKKNMIRILALVLVLILALGLIPLGAMAATLSVTEAIFDKNNPTYTDPVSFGKEYTPNQTPSNGKYTIKASDYSDYSLISIGGKLYDLKGVIDFEKTFQDGYDPKTPLVFSSSVTSADPWFYLGYTPHQHALSRWYSDGTTHWRQCLVCNDNFMYQNWCQDGDEDQVCNVCGGHVPYHDITVINSEGGSITVNRDNASHRMKITADVDTNEGYQFVKLHFTKVRPDGSKQEVVRYEKCGQFWTNMPTYPMEVTAEFVKK